jgi:hypothetical protein
MARSRPTLCPLRVKGAFTLKGHELPEGEIMPLERTMSAGILIWTDLALVLVRTDSIINSIAKQKRGCGCF